MVLLRFYYAKLLFIFSVDDSDDRWDL